MKTYVKKLFLLLALMAGLGLMLAGRVTAQTFTTLYSFTQSFGAPGEPYNFTADSGPSGNTDSDGFCLSLMLKQTHYTKEFCIGFIL